PAEPLESAAERARERGSGTRAEQREPTEVSAPQPGPDHADEPTVADAASGASVELVTADAAFELGERLQAAGDLSRAKEAYSFADDQGHASAAFNLARVLDQEGDSASAIEAYRRAAQRG